MVLRNNLGELELPVGVAPEDLGRLLEEIAKEIPVVRMWVMGDDPGSIGLLIILKKGESEQLAIGRILGLLQSNDFEVEPMIKEEGAWQKVCGTVDAMVMKPTEGAVKVYETVESLRIILGEGFKPQYGPK